MNVKQEQPKVHFEILDGLRGVAAMIVVVYHVIGIPVDFIPEKVPFHHAHLAVDFFFGLSGFVIAYAYDDRWGKMGVKDFFIARLIRLHPLLVLGTIAGLLSYLFDPFRPNSQNAPLLSVLIAFIGALFVLPNASLPNRWTDTHSLNGPTWTLVQEYIGNIAYALILKRLNNKALLVIAIMAGIGLFVAGMAKNSIDGGWGWNNLWMAPTRLAYPFIMGILLFRLRNKIKLPQLGIIPLSIIMIAVTLAPIFPKIGNFGFNGIYEALAVIFIFPFIILSGAHSKQSANMLKFCNISGRISYPIYITHFPFMYIFMNFAQNLKPKLEVVVYAGVFAFIFATAFAWAALRIYDEPLRKKLKTLLLKR